MGDFFGDLGRSIARVHGRGSAQTVADIYDAARKSGVTAPGKPGSFSIGTELNMPNYRLITPAEAAGTGRYKKAGITEQDADNLHQESMQDPNHYITKLTPEAYYRSIYGDKWEEVKKAALLSQSRPHPGNLSSHPAMRWVTPIDTNAALGRDVYVIDSPGLGYFHAAGGPVNGSAMTRNGHNMILLSRAADRLFGTGRHEMGHMLDTSIPDRDAARAPFLSGVSAGNAYPNRFVEFRTDLGGLKSGEFQRTGKAVGNVDDANDFVQALLKSDVKPTDPDPVANFGPRKGQPISGHSHRMSMIKALLGSVPESQRKAEQAKVASLLPKVFSYVGPVIAGAAAGQGADKQ